MHRFDSLFLAARRMGPIGVVALLAVVAVVAAILWPVFAQSREKARVAYQTERMGSAVARLAQDYDETAKAPSGSSSGESNTPAMGPGAAVTRRIIYTSQVDLVAEDLTKAERELTRLVKAHGGFIAGMEVSGTPRAPRSGQWTVRVPVARFEAFMEAVERLGELQKIHTDSQDVTEEYTDLGARLANKRVEERRLLRHLTQSTGKLQEILAVEKELSRVREEVEQIEGRLRLLTNQTELTTVTVSLNEVREYRPPQLPGFGQQVARTFTDSASALRDFLKAFALMVVAAIPWLLSLALACGVGVMAWRRLSEVKSEK